MADDRLEELGQRLEKATRRSSFAKYLRENFLEFEATLKAKGVRWETIARWAVETGLTGGRVLTAAAAKKTFERVAKERKRDAVAGSAVRSGMVEILRKPEPRPTPSPTPTPTPTPTPARPISDDNLDAKLGRALSSMNSAADPKDKRPSTPEEHDAEHKAWIESMSAKADRGTIHEHLPKPRGADQLERARERLRKSDERLR